MIFNDLRPLTAINVENRKRYISPYPIEEQMEYNSYLLDLPELKALRHNDISKEELVKMLKDKMTKEELLSLLLG